MSVNIQTIEDLKNYLEGAFGRAEDHAGNVSEVVICLAGCVCMYADPSTLKARTYAGSIANMVWFVADMSQQKYCMSYDHEEKNIKIRLNSMKGEVIASISNENTPREIIDIFKEL